MGVITTKGAPIVREYLPTRDAVLPNKEPVPRGYVPRSRVAQHALSIILPFGLALILLIGWYSSTALGHINSLLLPAPTDVFASLVDGISSGVFLSNTFITVQESVLGFLLALVLALPLGYGVAKSRILAGTIQPYLVAGQAIPAIVLAPLLQIWLGFGLMTIMTLCMLVVLFPIVINTILGIQTIDRTLLEAARVEGASGWSLLAHIEFPLALPAILAAIRTGLTLSVVGALVGEFVAAGDYGLGSLVLQALHQYNVSFMFATLVVLAALAVIYYGVTWLLVKIANLIY